MTNPAGKPSDAARRMAGDGIYSEIPEINQRIIDCLPKLLADGFALEDARPIPYGSRLTLAGPDGSAAVNLYYSRKKGHSTVFDKSLPGALVKRLRPLLDPGTPADRISPVKREQQFASWIGCDEGGKGAFTGPLVAVAFLADRSVAATLADMGVADSKRLTGTALRRLAAELEKRFRQRIAVVELVPETYNRLYSDFKQQGKSLNHLLAWAHGKAVEQLMPARPDAVIVDQFAYPGVIRPRMPDGPELILRPRAENNIAVAAASVVAGGRYLVRLDSLSKEFGVKLAPGAGAAADTSVRAFIRKHGKDAAHTVAKIHFKNMEKVQSPEIFSA